MTYPVFLHEFLPGKNKGISYGSPVLIPGEGKDVHTLAGYRPQM